MAQDDQERIQRIYNLYKERVFRVQGEKLNGSGVALGQNLLLTAAHLGFQFSNQYMITGLNNVQLPVNVEYISRDGDFAFLKSNDLPARRMDHDNFNVGEKYFLMGYPAEVLQSTPSICMGVVESFYSDGYHLAGSPGARRGYSGGPTFDRDGALAGILIGGGKELNIKSSFEDLLSQSTEQNIVRILPIGIIKCAHQTSPTDENSL